MEKGKFMIRVMTFNIQGENWCTEGQYSWDNRAEFVVETVLRARPGVVGFQEIDTQSYAFLREKLVGYEHVPGEWVPETRMPGWCTIFWRTAVFERLDSGTFWLSDTPDDPSLSWDVEYPMIVQWVCLRHRENGRSLLHFNTHLEDGADGERQRQLSGQLMVQRVAAMQKEGEAVVLTGDFNCDAESWAYDHFLANGFVDSYLAIRKEEATTFHGFEGEGYDGRRWGGDNPYWRVDWILVRGTLTLVEATIIRDAQPPLYPSDHYPVMATLGWD
jgi:endonuclease/exonuclease/phosphatase family metal-dependent hydrolase